MAIVTNRNEIVLGDQQGRKQTVLTIPAQAATDKPGVLALQSVADGGERTNYFIWVDATGALRIHTAIPTDQLTSGSAVAAGGGALTTLANIASVAIPVTIASDTPATDDLGTEPIPWRGVYVGKTVGVVFVGTTFNTSVVVTEPSASLIYTLPDAGAAANVMLDTGAANVIAYTKGTSTIGMAANADLVIATGITATFNAACTIGAGAALTTSTEAITLNQSLSTTDAVTFTDISGATLGLSAALTCKGITNTTTAIDSTVAINIGADNVNLTLGGSGVADSKIFFDGANLSFWDVHNATTYTLTQLATGTTLNPTVTGDLTVGDGKFNWTDAADEIAGTWSFASAGAGSDIDIATITDSGECIHIIDNALTTGHTLHIETTQIGAAGALVYLDATVAGHNATGNFIECFDGAGDVFEVGKYGAVIIAGSAAGTAAATLTLGDVVISGGRLTQTTTGDFGNTLARNNATGTAAVLTVQEVHVTGGTTLLVDSDATDGNHALVVTHAGTGSGAHITTAAVTGTALTVVGPAAQTFPQIKLDGTATTGWGGAANTGMLHLALDGATLATTASAIQVVMGTGTPTDASLGYALYINDTTTAAVTPASTYAVYLAATGAVANASNSGMAIVTGGTGARNLVLSGVANQAVSQLTLDGTTGNWVGANDVGMLHLTCDGALANAGATLIRSSFVGTAAAASEGVCAIFEDGSAAATTTAAVNIISTANDCLRLTCTDATQNALNIVTGISEINGTINHGGLLVSDQAAQTLTGAGAVDITSTITWLVTNAGNALTLANGAEGQHKYIIMKTDGGDGTLTPASVPSGYATIKFTAVGHSVHLLYTNAAWQIVGYFGVTIA